MRHLRSDRDIGFFIIHSFSLVCHDLQATLRKNLRNTCNPTFLPSLWCHLLGYTGTTSSAPVNSVSLWHAQVSIGSIAWRVCYLDGLSEAALPQNLSVDEVRRAEDSVRAIGHDAERLWSIDVLPLWNGGCGIAGARRLVNAVAPPWGRHGGRWRHRRDVRTRVVGITPFK